MGDTERDALVTREVSMDGSVWDIKRILQRRVAAHVEAGWIVLITTDQMMDKIRRPFNPPR